MKPSFQNKRYRKVNFDGFLKQRTLPSPPIIIDLSHFQWFSIHLHSIFWKEKANKTEKLISVVHLCYLGSIHCVNNNSCQPFQRWTISKKRNRFQMMTLLCWSLTKHYHQPVQEFRSQLKVLKWVGFVRGGFFALLMNHLFFAEEWENECRSHPRNTNGKQRHQVFWKFKVSFLDVFEWSLLWIVCFSSQINDTQKKMDDEPENKAKNEV